MVSQVMSKVGNVLGGNGKRIRQCDPPYLRRHVKQPRLSCFEPFLLLTTSWVVAGPVASLTLPSATDGPAPPPVVPTDSVRGDTKALPG